MKEKKNMLRGNFIKWPLINNSERDTFIVSGSRVELLVFDKILVFFYGFIVSQTKIVLGVNIQVWLFYGRRHEMCEVVTQR